MLLRVVTVEKQHHPFDRSAIGITGNIIAMTFIITWSTSTGGAATVRRQSPVEALSKALVLLVQGFEDVVIFDKGGKGTGYAPADFGQFFVVTRKWCLADPEAESGDKHASANLSG